MKRLDFNWFQVHVHSILDFVWQHLDTSSGNSFRRQRTNRSCMDVPYQLLEPRKVLTSGLPTFDVDAGVMYQIHGVNGAQGQLSQIDVIQKSFVDIGQKAGFKINGTGFRSSDGYIYGIKMDKDELIRLGANGEHEILGSIGGLPNGNYFTGDFGQDGLLYLRHNNVYYGVNVDTVEVERVAMADADVKKTYDVTYNPETGLHYSIRKNGKKAEFISIDLTADDGIARVEIINDNLTPVGTYGGLFGDASGRVFAANNAGGLYEVDVETGVATFAGYSPRASSNDGAFSSLAYLDLPPVAINSWMTVVPGTESQSIPIEAPYDLEGKDLTITIEELPADGAVVNSHGEQIEAGQALTVEELVNLSYQPDDQSDPESPNQFLRYNVGDGVHQVSAAVEIDFAGRSMIEGQVVVVDDSEESSYAGYAYQVEVTLAGTDLYGDAVERSVFTDVYGRYQFVDVLPGTYTVEQFQPPTVYDAYVEQNELDGSVDANRVANFTIGNMPGSIRGADFFEYAPSLLSGFVYVDNNGNGVIDVSESGISNVTLVLAGADIDGNDVEVTTVSDSYGFYQFDGLVPGKYTVTQNQPAGFINAGVSVGYLGGEAGPNTISSIELGPGQQGLKYHFGEYESSSIRGSVFIDNDLDKAFDLGDTPLPGVTLRLSGVDFKDQSVSIETQSDSDGNYLFNHLLAGTYQIVEVQPDDLEDGHASVGLFNNDEKVLPSNGIADTNRIHEIKLGFGRHGRSFNFSEAVDYEFATHFEKFYIFEGTESDDLVRFSPGDEFHRIEINDDEYFVDASFHSSIQVLGLDGTDQFVINGTERVEQVFTWDGSAVMRSETWRFGALSAENLQINSGGGYDRAFMYDTINDDRAKMTQDYTRLWNDDFYAETRGFHRSYVYADYGGADRVYLYDSKYDDTVKLTPHNARMISRKFYAFSRGFERVYSYSQNGGQDRAQFWDSPEDRDILQATPDYSRMYNNDFYNIAVNFHQIDAFGFSGGSGDQAHLIGSEETEQLIASPIKSGMAGADFKYDVHGFERTYAFSNGGNDRALLFDSKLDDRFVTSPESARMYNDQFYLIANGFSRVDGFSSSGGDDRAYFYDSEGDDVLITHENRSRLFGDGFDNNGHGFARSYAHSTNGGEDRAFLYDTDQADTVKIDSQVAKMYGTTYYSWMNGFEDVVARFTSTSRHDRALVFGSIDEDSLTVSGDQAKLIYDHALEFIYDVDEHDGDDSDDSDLSSIYDDLVELLGGEF